MPDSLRVSLYGTAIGTLTRAADGSADFTWSADAERRWPLNSPVLSRGLRVGTSPGGQAEAFFGALLPEGVHLDRLATSSQVSSNDVVGLLDRVGADLAGALRVGDVREPEEPERLGPEQVDELLARADGFLVGGGGSALPGFQRKLTLTRRDGAWFRGNGTLPSTHILKPVGAEYRAAVEAENYTIAIARALGLASFDTWVEQIGDRQVLVIERYDRSVSGGTIERIHQEDAGQAMGLPWKGNAKFENVDERASLQGVASLLDTRATVLGPAGRRSPDKDRLLRYTVVNVAVGNTDAHAKNFSLLHPADGSTRLAPFYDAAPLALSYDSDRVLAMRVDGMFQIDEITAEALVAEGRSWGLPADHARDIVRTTLTDIVAATRTIVAHESIERHVPGYVRGRAQNMLEGRVARIPSVVPLMALPRLGSEQPRTAS